MLRLHRLSAGHRQRRTRHRCPSIFPRGIPPPDWIHDAPIFDETARQSQSSNHRFVSRPQSADSHRPNQRHVGRSPNYQARRDPLSSTSHGTQRSAPRAVANSSLMPGQVPLAEVTRPSAWTIQLGRSGSASAAILDPNVEPSFYQEPRARGPATSLDPLTRQPLSQRASSASRCWLELLPGEAFCRSGATVVSVEPVTPPI